MPQAHSMKLQRSNLLTSAAFSRREVVVSWVHVDQCWRWAFGNEEIGTYINSVCRGYAILACSNSRISTAVSGEIDVITELQNNLGRFAIFSRKLKIDTAYHTHHMVAVAEKYSCNIHNLDHRDTNTAGNSTLVLQGLKSFQVLGLRIGSKNGFRRSAFEKRSTKLAHDSYQVCGT